MAKTSLIWTAILILAPCLCLAETVSLRIDRGDYSITCTPACDSDAVQRSLSTIESEIRLLKAEIRSREASGLTADAQRDELAVLNREATDLRTRPHHRLDEGGDDCAQAEEIATLPYCDSGTTEEKLNDWETQCVGFGGSDLFYKFTPESNITISVSLCGSEFDTGLEIFDDCPYDGGSSLGCSDDDCGDGLASCLSGLELTGGITYYICIDAYDENTGGGYQLTVREGTVECPFEGCDPVVNCAEFPACDVPEEIEPNNSCPEGIDFNVLSCNTSVYGVHCPLEDHDFYLWEVPVGYYATVTVFGWEGCIFPETHSFNLYDDQCQLITAGTSSAALRNETAAPLIFYVDLNAGDLGPYKLTTTCCEFEDFCQTPIPVPDGPAFIDTLSTCCGDYTILSYPDGGCEPPVLAAGPTVVYQLTLTQPRIIDIYVEALDGTHDEQALIFTDCIDPLGTCLAATGDGGHTIGPEALLDLSLTPGTYYLAAAFAFYEQFADCGTMEIRVIAEIPSVEELTVIGDATGVTLRWTTPGDGFDAVYSTSSTHHDGNPDNGSDPEWLLEATLPVAAGAVQWADPSATGAYKCYAIVHSE